MYYYSTRGENKRLSFFDAVLSGTATDGGLYIPDHFPHFSAKEIDSWKNLPYEQLALRIIEPFVNKEIPRKDLLAILEKTYLSFHDEVVAPLIRFNDNLSILELFHGHTLAFKDYALSFLGNLLEYILEKTGQKIVIVGATSGDTGSAAIEGCKHIKNATIFIMHPKNMVSEFQRKQMTTVDSPNVFNIALRGSFDDCQNFVKTFFVDDEITSKAKLVAVNSINWARILGQMVYYFYAYFQAVKSNSEKVNFIVPSGNSGNILAGFYAKKMGLNVGKLIFATNSNDILHRFIKDNDYSIRNLVPTCSPSMDIQISSNFERLAYEFYLDTAKIKELFEGLKKTGKLNISKEIHHEMTKSFFSYAVDDYNIKETIQKFYKKYGYIVCPHTATAIKAYNELHKTIGGNNIVLATAHPAKFGETIVDAINKSPETPEFLQNLYSKKEKFSELDSNYKQVKEFILERV